MKRTAEELVKMFSERGLNITPQRRLIFELLARDNSHPTADSLYKRVVAVMPNVSRTTVYNTMRDLVALGELAEVEDLSDGGKRYDTNPENHHHLFCVNCRELVDIDRDFDCVNLPEEAAAGYSILRSQVTFYGRCPECRNK